MAEKIDIGSVSYAFGILSIVFAFFSPFAGLVIGIIGFTQSNKRKFQKAKRLNLVGILLSALLIIITIVALVYFPGINTLPTI